VCAKGFARPRGLGPLCTAGSRAERDRDRKQKRRGRRALPHLRAVSAGADPQGARRGLAGDWSESEAAQLVVAGALRPLLRSGADRRNRNRGGNRWRVRPNVFRGQNDRRLFQISKQDWCGRRDRSAGAGAAAEEMRREAAEALRARLPRGQGARTLLVGLQGFFPVSPAFVELGRAACPGSFREIGDAFGVGAMRNGRQEVWPSWIASAAATPAFLLPSFISHGVVGAGPGFR